MLTDPRASTSLSPAQCIGQPISHLLYPEDAAVFAEASLQLQQDDSHTVEAHFRLRVLGENEDPDDHSQEQFEAMEGKGMLIRDRITAEPSHTMWVIRPASSAASGSDDGEATTVKPPQGMSHLRGPSEPITPFPATSGRTLSTQPVLCRICDRQIPTWFFEKHSETCNTTHRLELDINDVNDRINDLREIAASFLADLKLQAQAGSSSPSGNHRVLEYQDMVLLPARFRERQIQFLEELLDIFGTALDIAMPALSEDSTPIENQRLLSPNSEDHLTTLQGWQAPACDDPALRKLAEDFTDMCRQKITAVNRLRNTIFYVERVRTEWENQAQALLSSITEEESTGSQSPPPSPAPTVRDCSTLAASSQSRQPSNQPTPVPQAAGRFGSDHLSPPVHTIPAVSSTGSPASMQPTSPAGLLNPLPLLDQVISPSHSSSFSSPSDGFAPKSPIPLVPQSPRMSSGGPSKAGKASSIKDFDIIKPISKGAFGSVYLAKKRTTGDYYAIKVLKKADMIAKNQVTNVKAERKILMTQSDSDFAVKLFWTFQSKDYLVRVEAGDTLPCATVADFNQSADTVPRDGVPERRRLCSLDQSHGES